MPLFRSAATLPSAAAHLAWMCVVAAVALCGDGIIMVTRCNKSPLNACVQYSIGHSSVTIVPSSAISLPELAAGSWQVTAPHDNSDDTLDTPAALLRISRVILQCAQVFDAK
jgi:hypothetical protein